MCSGVRIQWINSTLGVCGSRDETLREGGVDVAQRDEPGRRLVVLYVYVAPRLGGRRGRQTASGDLAQWRHTAAADAVQRLQLGDEVRLVSHNACTLCSRLYNRLYNRLDETFWIFIRWNAPHRLLSTQPPCCDAMTACVNVLTGLAGLICIVHPSSSNRLYNRLYNGL